MWSRPPIVSFIVASSVCGCASLEGARVKLIFLWAGMNVSETVEDLDPSGLSRFRSITVGSVIGESDLIKTLARPPSGTTS